MLKRSGRTLLRYSGLHAVDARGHALRSWLQIERSGVLIRVDDRGASYPLSVDPFVQAKLTAADGAANDGLGFSVAVSADGSTIVAGAPGVNSLSGGVYVFERGHGGWTTESAPALLTASDGASSDELGWSVGVSGDGSVVVAGAPFASAATNARGAAYVFVRGSDGWATSTQAKLTASDAANFNHLGISVAVSADGSRVAAGSPNATVGAMAQGAVYLFARGATGVWASEFEFKKLWAPDGAAGAHLGTSVAVSGDQLAVAGAPNATLSMNANQGAAYVFQDVLGSRLAGDGEAHRRRWRPGRSARLLGRDLGRDGRCGSSVHDRLDAGQPGRRLCVRQAAKRRWTGGRTRARRPG